MFDLKHLKAFSSNNQRFAYSIDRFNLFIQGSLNGKLCEVKSGYNMKLSKSVKIYFKRYSDFELSNQYKRSKPSSEHIVYYCFLETSSKLIHCVTKFCFDRSLQAVSKFDSKHGVDIIENYNNLADYLTTATDINTKITLNGCCILKCDNLHLWVEQEIKDFQKFWYMPLLTQYDVEMQAVYMANTSNKLLRKLQVAMFLFYNKEKTICDLQGGYRSSSIVLGDIEFTNTLIKLNWEPESLLNAFNAPNEIEIQEYLLLKQSIKIRKQEVVNNKKRKKSNENEDLDTDLDFNKNNLGLNISTTSEF